jgi:hypothetical protein
VEDAPVKKTLLVAALLCVLFANAAWAGPQDFWKLRPYVTLEGPRASLAKDPAPQVGDTHTFWGWDMSAMPPSDVQIPATCRGVSDYGYVFVEDAQWNVSMDQAAVDNILAAWDEATPAGSIDPDKGIYDIETSLFGDPPDVDGWPGVVLLYYEMGCFMGYCFDGFYRYQDQLNIEHSNQMDMIHFDPTHNNPGEEYMLGVTAHEFNHMLQMVTDQSEAMWLSESLAEAAMIVTGYDTDLAWLADFVADPTVSFWGDGQTVNYGAALLLGTYLYEIGGAALLQAITADSSHGVLSVEDQLIALDLAPSFAVFFGDMAAAIAADYFVDQGAAEADGRFHYELLSVGELAWSETLDNSTGAAEWTASVAGGAIAPAFIDLTAGDLAGSVALAFDDSTASGAEAALITLGASAIGVRRIDAGDEDWPTVTVDLAGADAALLVLANSATGSLETTIGLTFAAGDDDDDDSTPDDDDNDATPGGDDDDDNDDDSGSAGDDDDDDSGGCGC